jgi:hypothetical protein
MHQDHKGPRVAIPRAAIVIAHPDRVRQWSERPFVLVTVEFMIGVDGDVGVGDGDGDGGGGGDGGGRGGFKGKREKKIETRGEGR